MALPITIGRMRGFHALAGLWRNPREGFTPSRTHPWDIYEKMKGEEGGALDGREWADQVVENRDPMRTSYLHVVIVATFLIAVPAFGDTQAVPPEVQALAEATSQANAFCEAIEVQMFPDGGAAFLWLLGDCGMRGCLTLIRVQDANPDGKQ